VQLDERAAGLIPRSNLWWQGAVLFFLILWLYASIVRSLVLQWWEDPNFSHGFFVPAFCLFVVWRGRKKLFTTPHEPSCYGFLIIILALSMLVIGVLGAELFLARTSLLLLTAGLIISFAGWPMFRVVAFPWAFLFLMIPIPAIIFNQVTLPLQLLASKFAALALPAFGVPVLRQGNIIQLPVILLEIAEACSGIRSLLSLATFSIIYGYLMETRISIRVLLGLGSVPIAVAANSVRIVGTGLLVEYMDPEKAEGFFHIFSGWVMFLISLSMLFGLHRLLQLGKLGRRDEELQSSDHSGGLPAVPSQIS
jgi:exosortase